MARVHLQGVFMQFPSPALLRFPSQKYVVLHGIPHIIGTVDGSHIMIFVHVIGGNDYYYNMSFHSTILTGIDTICTFWNYKIG